MPVTQLTTTNMAASVKTFFDKKLLRHVRQKNIHHLFGIDDSVASGHKSKEWRYYPALGISSNPENLYTDGTPGIRLVEGVTPGDSQVLTLTQVTATPDQFGTYAEGSDLVDPLSIDPTLKLTVERLGQQAAESLDRIDRNVLVGGTTIQYAGTATSVATVAPGMLLNIPELIEARKTLKKNKVEPCKNGRYCAVLSPEGWATLMSDPLYQDMVIHGGDNNLRDGSLGTILEIEFYESPDAYSQAGALTTVHHTLIFGKEGYGVIKWDGMGLETIYTPPGGKGDPFNQRWTQAWKASHKCVILNNAFFLQIRHAAVV